MRNLITKETSNLVVKLVLLMLLSGAVVMTAQVQQQRTETQCVPEVNARQIAANSPLPKYPDDEMEPGSSAGVVFVAVEFGTDGRFSKMKAHQTPGTQVTEAVKTALKQWKLKELFDSSGQPIKTRTGLRFHFVFEEGKGRVDLANEQEQLEFGGDWGKKVCRISLDD